MLLREQIEMVKITDFSKTQSKYNEIQKSLEHTT